MDSKTGMIAGAVGVGALALGWWYGSGRVAAGGAGGGGGVGRSRVASDSVPDSAATVEEQMAEFRLQARRLELQLEALKAASPPTLGRQQSKLEDGTLVDLSPTEIVRLKEIFGLFDRGHRGYIGADEVQDVHARLGEPITDAEAAAAVTAMDARDGKVTFASFVRWWVSSHIPDGATRGDSARYAARFKFLKAKIANPQIARVSAEGEGVFPSLEWRCRFFHTDAHGIKSQISPWHSIPLKNDDGTLNFICEIPKWTRRKHEIATGEPFNPIKQDTKNGALREYKWGDMLFNYGAFPQTWEDPEHVTEDTGAIGDNDPLDVMELGSKQWPTGSIVKVKVLGVLALIDSGETDWKVLTINVEDPLADKLNDVEDVRAHMPGAIEAIHGWLRDYKSPTINEFGFAGECQSRDYAMSVVEETHEFWKRLVARHPNAVGGATV